MSTLGGGLSDRFGRSRLIIAGWLVYAVVYAGFALSESLIALLIWFLAYGVHFALVEGSEKALVADLTPGAAAGHRVWLVQRGARPWRAGGQPLVRGVVGGIRAADRVSDRRRAGVLAAVLLAAIAYRADGRAEAGARHRRGLGPPAISLCCC